MSNILILGAHGSIAQHPLELFLHTLDAQLTPYQCRSIRFASLQSHRVRVIEGDVMDVGRLKKVIPEQDVVYALLSGRLEAMAATIVTAMGRQVSGDSSGSARWESKLKFRRKVSERAGSVSEVGRDPGGFSAQRYNSPTRLVHRSGRGRLRDDPERGIVQRIGDIAQERGRSGSETGGVAGPGGPSQRSRTRSGT